MGCGSVNVTKLPGEQELSRFYSDYVNTYCGGGGHLKQYGRKYLQLLQKHTTAGRLLDVGSSNNPFPSFAQHAGFSVHVLDYVRPPDLDPAVKFVRGSLSSRNANLLFEEAFDVVSAWAVLEHVPDPSDAIKGLAMLVKPGGICLVLVPEQGTRLTELAAGRSRWFYPPEHLHLPSPRGLERVFADHGLQVCQRGRFELNAMRYAARYGIGLVEAIAGALLRASVPSVWLRLRDQRRQLFAGMVFFVFRRNTGAED